MLEFGPVPIAEDEHATLRWLNQAFDEALGGNKSQYNYDKIGAVIDSIMGVDEPRVRSPHLSGARLNRIQKIALEMRSMLTDIKPFWVYSANSKRFEKQAEIFGKLAKHWYLSRNVDQVFCDTIDYVLAAGTGYIHMFWNPDLDGPPGPDGIPTMGDIDVSAEDPRDVAPFRFSGGKKTLQGCRGVFIRRERPYDWMKRVYGRKAEKIKIDRFGLEKESPSQKRYREAQESQLATNVGPFAEQLFGGQPMHKLSGPQPIVDEITCYLKDFTVNTSATPKEMGEFMDAVARDGQQIRVPKYSWCYIVAPGKRLYPFGRRIVATRYGVIEDGPSHFQHGMLPVCKVTLDTWAWSWIGTSPIQPLLSLQRATDETVRAVQDHIRRLSRKGMAYDKNALSSAVARKIDLRRDNAKIALNPHAAGPKGAFMVIEEQALDKTVPEWLKFLIESMDELSGIAALKNIAALNQVPSTETIDKIIDSMTPLVRARSRSMEVFIREFAMMLASMFMQFWTVDLRLRVLGPDGMTQEDWDYRPGDLVPDFINDEDYNADGSVSDLAIGRGASPDHIRNREFSRFFSYDVAPGTLLDAATVTKRMLYVQLARMGLVDHWSLLEVLQVPNVGKPPAWATDITKRLQAERLMGLGIIASTAGRAPTGQTMPSMTSDGAMSESG